MGRKALAVQALAAGAVKARIPSLKGEEEIAGRKATGIKTDAVALQRPVAGNAQKV